MLQESPCIDPLFGCTESNTDTYSRSSVASQSSVSSSSSSASSAGVFTSQLSSGSVRLSAYTVTAMNRGSQPVTGFIFTHGPLPSGAMLDTQRSSKSCIQSGTFVQCTVDLQTGESKNLEIIYIVNNATSCEIARPLQSVTPVSQPTGTNVSLSVVCVMKNEGVFQSSAQSSVSSVAIYTAPTHGAGTVDTTKTYTQETKTDDYKTGTKSDGYKDVELGKGKGYKPYPKPRAGAMSDYFTRVTNGSLLVPVKHANGLDGFGISAWVFAVPIVVVAVATALVIVYRRMQHI